MKTDTPRKDEWETYCDECYYHLWRVRRKNERGFNDGYHVHNGKEAKALVDLLNKQDSELNAVTEQRDAVTLRLGRTQEKMFNAERQRDRLAEDTELFLSQLLASLAPLIETLTAVKGGSEKPAILIHNGVGIADMYSPDEFENAMKLTNQK